MLASKAARYGRTFVQVDRWFPSSKLCSACGALAESMPLSVRSWECGCGAGHDRDVNAAINILAAGRADRLTACGAPVRPGPAPARREEAGSRRGAA
ncbi:zinc ribbon domain-containing protein [Thermoactinospora rubra]|uniref:zinc ribbon domain-containing protein n=1 Tax=Thermoactinospora rubra TaxID=1088767 RepID=UPI003B8473B0